MAHVNWADFRTPPINLWVLPPWRETPRQKHRRAAAGHSAAIMEVRRQLARLLAHRGREG